MHGSIAKIKVAFFLAADMLLHYMVCPFWLVSVSCTVFFFSFNNLANISWDTLYAGLSVCLGYVQQNMSFLHNNFIVSQARIVVLQLMN